MRRPTALGLLLSRRAARAAMRLLPLSALAAVLAPPLAPAAGAAEVAAFAPLGTVKRVRQVQVRFSAPMVPLGDPGCVPVTPMTVQLSAPVAREAARGVVLVGPDGRRAAPEIEGDAAFVWRVAFPGPFPELTPFRVELPADLRDDAGRTLANRSAYPLAVRTEAFPPLAKFSARFGIVERADPVLPVTLRNLEREVQVRLLRVDRPPGAGGLRDWVRGRLFRIPPALSEDNATGEVLAYVGGSGELASARHVDGVRARRQAGSALKPFLYGLALEMRLVTPATVLEDAPLELAVTGGLYRPRNYDERFRGRVTARTALAASLNVPAVRVLGLVGGEPFAERLRQLGLGGLDEAADFYGPALALGAAEVSLWELVGAYRALARGGVWGPLTLLPRETAARPPERRVYPEPVAFLVGDILAGRESRSATFGLENALATRFWTAVKTGTSKEMRDNWCVGYSLRYTAGVWVGNFSGAPMHDVSGVTGAAPVWRELMAWLHRATPGRAPPRPPASSPAPTASGTWRGPSPPASGCFGRPRAPDRASAVSRPPEADRAPRSLRRPPPGGQRARRRES
jgi:hypothetical protein